MVSLARIIGAAFVLALSPAPAPAQVTPPPIVADWDARPNGAEWTRLAQRQLLDIGGALLAAVPSDIGEFCPGYAALSRNSRAAFWVGLLSAMARFESSFDPGVAFDEYAHCRDDACRRVMVTRDGRHVVSRGLLQLSQESANAYRGCTVPPAGETRLHEPELNLRCGVAIMSAVVVRDGVLTARTGGRWRGGAAYWSVLRDGGGRQSLTAIRQFTRRLPVCGRSRDG